MDIIYSSLTRKQLKEKTFSDTHYILSYQSESRENIFKSNPFFTEDSTYIYVAHVNNNIVGRCYYFPTRFKAEEEIIPAQSASALYVQKKFRTLAVGADIIAYSTFSEEYSLKIFAGISSMALPIYKKLKYCVFPLQRYLIRRNFNSYLQQKGLHGIIGRLIAKGISFMNQVRIRLHGHYRDLTAQYTIKQMDIVPEWVDEISLHDGHKYMEAHNYQWLQWQLSGSFYSGKRNIQKFYGIFEKNNPIGFFMTKERVINEDAGMINGSIIEWGSKRETELTESDIYEMALRTFSDDIYIVDVATNDERTIQRIKKLGFVFAGEEHILFKDNTKEYKDASDPHLWRLRYGYADTIFS